jgi:L-serine dehydratase
MASPTKPISIFNDVLGPVMRGPSSSHTAAAFHIGTIARGLLGEPAAEATFTFDAHGSFGQVFRQQASDLAFATGLMGWSITDERFPQALQVAADQGMCIDFRVTDLPEVDHPNVVDSKMVGRDGARFQARAKSIGGGAVVFTELNGWPIRLTGDAHEVLLVTIPDRLPSAREILIRDGEALGEPTVVTRGDTVLLHVRRGAPLPEEQLAALADTGEVWTAPPIFFPQRGTPLGASAADLLAQAEARDLSLGQVALVYESTLLGLTEGEVLAEVTRRFDVMRAAVDRGLTDPPPMQLLEPTAGEVARAEAEGRVAIGGIHTRAAAAAMAVMHVNGGNGVVCAAPTAGSAGAVPGTLVTLARAWDLAPEPAAMALLAAGAVGLVLGTRATFAAEVAGCQVEIGAAGAMAAAGVVEAAGGSARAAADAAAISFQNTMGLPCDLVQGAVEIPCHTRNGIAAASAFVCADLILGGYVNPIPLDETIDAAYAVGQMLPREIKCTALGGLALAPSAQAMRCRHR